MKINSTVRMMRLTLRKALLISAICFTGIITADAAGTTDSTNNEVTLSTMKVVNGEMSFTMKYDNVNNDRLEIVLRDKEGNRLFQQVIKEKNVNKTFKVDPEIRSLTLTVINLNDKTEQKFEIFNHIRTIEKVIVTSIN